MNEIITAGSQSASILESKLLDQEQQPEVNDPAATFADRRPTPNVAKPYIDKNAGYMHEGYTIVSDLLYKASVKCDWHAAKHLLETLPDLVRHSITGNGETALHVAASQRNKHVTTYVKNLVNMMKREDLELENENFSTAFYLAAAAGNVEILKIMAEKNIMLMTIPGANQSMMPLYAAALFGHYEVVKYLYEFEWIYDGWSHQNHVWLLEKCVETDMFDVSLKIVKEYPELVDYGRILKILAEKPYAFPEIKSNTIKRRIHSVFRLIGLTWEASGKESGALELLRFIWLDIVKRPKKEIDSILRGEADSSEQQEKAMSKKVVQALQLQKLINENLDKLEEETNYIIKELSNDTQQDTESATGTLDQALQLGKLISEYMVNMHVETQNLFKTDNQHVYDEKDQALGLQNLISKRIVCMHEEVQNISRYAFSDEWEDKAKTLPELIYQNIWDMRNKTEFLMMNLTIKTYSSRVVFVAAEMGNTGFLLELIRGYSDLIWKVNDSGQTVFHIAVKNRKESMYNLIYQIGSMKDTVTPIRDINGNNMLHLAGKMPTGKTLSDVSGAALRMQRELLWFKEVRSIVPPSFINRKNKDGLTPQELFTKEHKELVAEGEKWMKETASQCMVVAALIATIVFATAFTIPGGYNQNNGIPIFYGKSTFVAFVVADAMSLFLSSSSILTFLSILTSRYSEGDFVESLPKKLMLGVSTLFLSITAMMITFSISFFILYHNEMRWIPILIGAVALIPVVLYVVLQYHVLLDLIRLTYGSKYIFKPGKQYIYYVNPM